MTALRNSEEWASDLEARWSATLRGASLVTECAFDDDELEHAIEFLAHQLRRNSTKSIIRNNPAIFAVAFTQLGNRRWSEGNFYKNVAEELQARTSHFPDADKKVREIIRYFPSTLKRFRLATFENVNFKRRWVWLGLYQDMTTAAAKAGGVNTWISSFERAAVAQARPGAMGKGAIIGAAVTFAVCGTVIGTMKFRQARSSHLQDLKQKSVEAKEQINSHLADDNDDQPISSASAG